MRTYIFLIALVTIALSSCSDFLDIVPPEDKYDHEIFDDKTRAQEFLNPAYGDVQKSPNFSLEYYTDNAIMVSREREGITAENSPVEGEWSKAISNLLHINEFFDKGFDVSYNALDSALAVNLKARVRGEAFGLRAYYKWILLKNFAGPSAIDSTMLGFPIIDGMYTVEGMKDIGRASYLDCYSSIMADLDSAFKYINIRRYKGDGDISGDVFISRLSGEAIYAMKARVALFAASPAYKQISWTAAADTIYNAIKYIDGDVIIGLQAYGDYNDENNLDHFWRVSYSQTGSWERDHFPPSLYGKGECNPTQNLINTFSDHFGYPIDNPWGFYNAATPYLDRDPRFYRFVFYNGVNAFKSADIQTYAGGFDASGIYRKQGTRTGYYMKKYLNSKIDFDIKSSTNKESDFKVYPVFDRTTLYLDFAEAVANAYPVLPCQGPQMNFSAVAAVTSVRKRAGTAIAFDDYFEQEVVDMGDITAMKALIANERRIELAFSGERYYDMRRLKLPLDVMNQDVLGVRVSNNDDGSVSYADTVVVRPHFEKQMYYNPIPRQEILKSTALIQNAGWE